MKYKCWVLCSFKIWHFLAFYLKNEFVVKVIEEAGPPAAHKIADPVRPDPGRPSIRMEVGLGPTAFEGQVWKLCLW